MLDAGLKRTSCPMEMAVDVTNSHAPVDAIGEENALLKLAQALTTLVERDNASPESLTPLTVELRCDHWVNANDPRSSNIFARMSNVKSKADPRYATPTLVRERACERTEHE
jgi:hypothetical protein